MIVLAAADTLAAGASVAAQVTTTVMGMELNAGTETYKLLYQGQLGNTVATIYTVPGSTTAFIKSIHVVNNDSSGRTAQFAVNGTTAAKTIVPAITIPAGGFALFIAERGWTVYDSNGLVLGGSGGSLLRVTNILQGTTSFTPGAGTRALYVEMVGGGGGGGGCATGGATAGAGGGGAGAFSAIFTTTIKVYTVQVGAKGTGGASGANNGNPGTDSTFDSASICTAKAGLGGIAHTSATGPVVGGLGGAGGAASSGLGDIKADGGSGGAGVALAAAQGVSGKGGDSYFGAGANAVKTQSAGSAAVNYGGGGSGGCILSSGASVAGGNGADALIRIFEFA